MYKPANSIQRLAEAQVARESGSDDRTYQVPTSPVSDIELQLEIRYATILKQKRTVEQEKERLQKQMADVTTRLGRLQENNDHLQERLKETEDRLSLPIRDDATARLIKRLEDKIREQDELIEVQEGQFEEDREEKARIRRELEGLRTAATRIIQLEDELKELKFQNVELAKKANTVDRFKQKLEVQKGLEHDLKNLELENEELKFHYRNYNQVKQRNESLEATHLQFQNSIAKAEMEIFEIGSQKKMLDEEKAVLQRSLATLDERRVHDEQFILDLQEQLLSKSSPITKNSLEDELENSDQAARQNNLEVSRLKAENVLLKGNAFAAQENSSLRAQLEEAAAHRKVIETKYRDAFEKEAISQQQLRAMMNSVDDNSKFVEIAMSVGRFVLLTPEYYRQQAFLDLKNAHIRTTEQLSTLQKNYNAIEAELESTKREYLSATSDCKSTPYTFLYFYANIFSVSMVEKEDIDALEELKATQESLSKSFENELTALKSKHRALDIDHELQKSQLIDSLLANSKLRMTFEEESNAEAAASVEKGDAETPMEESDNALQTPNQPDVSNLLLLNHSQKFGFGNFRRRTSSISSRSKSSNLISQEIAQATIIARELAAERSVFGVFSQRSARSLPKPENVPLPESPLSSSYAEPFEVLEKDIERSLTDVFAGRGSTERKDDCGTSGKDPKRYSLSDILISEAMHVTTLEAAAQEAARVGAARIRAAKDEAARIEADEIQAARFAAEQIEAAQKQASFVEEAMRRKSERKSAFGKAISQFSRPSVGKRK